MNTIVLFHTTRCIEISPTNVLGELPFEKELAKFSSSKPLAKQLSLEPNVITPITNEIRGLHLIATMEYYSTIGIELVRIESSPYGQIQVGISTSSNEEEEGKTKDNTEDIVLAIYENELEVLTGNSIYLNGKKITIGKYPISAGDGLWIDESYFELHKTYLGCAGKFISRLNISTTTPNPYDDFPNYKRSPRIIKREPTEKLEIAAPQPKEERKKGELIGVILPPLATSLVMVGGGLLIGRGLFMIISAAAMVVSVTFSATKFISDKKARRKKEKQRDIYYDKYLLDKRKEIFKLYEGQRESLLYHNLSPKEIEQEILSYSSRVFERSANDSDFLTLSLGFGTVPSSYTLNYPRDVNKDGETDPLAEEMLGISQSFQTIPDMPTVIDLKGAHLGLVGEKPYIHRQLTSILTQLCFFQSYHDMEIILLVEEEDRRTFDWVRWYPQCRIKSINVTGFVTAENHRDQVLGNIAQVLKMRHQKQAEEKKDSRFLPHYVFIIDNPKLIINHSIMEYLQNPGTNLGFSLIYTTHLQANLPEYIKTVFRLDGGDYGTLLLNEGELLNRPVTLPVVAGIDLETMARRLTPLKHSQGISTQIPEAITFFELYNVKRPEEIPVLQKWSQNACHKSLAVPLGVRGKDDVVALNLHEKAHGPHGLIAGTTGSGKSEIVQSYILSLAVNFHPHEVGFLLIDYKGGGMANLFANLPHLLGTITNLDGSESMRALVSIKSELARRQRIFNENNVNSINQYTKLFKAGDATEPMPHLFLISDEFAELKKEQPEFMSELVSAARIGRSLGVHLILATQKPSGVVDDQIWSNSRFKLALKVANESDSNEVLKTPDAARITQPGRAYLQVGNNEIYELFQSAWSGAPYSEEVVERGFDSRVYAINQLGQGVLLNEDLSEVDTTEDSKLTQLDVVVNHIEDLYQGLQATVVEKPWLPPLSEKIVTPAIEAWGSVDATKDVGTITEQNLNVPLAMIDIPENQEQIEYSHNFMDEGNLAIFGAAGFGKSTILMNIALTLATQNSPSLLNFFILDYGNSALAQLRGLPHTADYLGVEDDEKLGKLETLLAEELKKRKQLFASVNALNFRMYNETAKEKLPTMILFIDNYDVIKEINVELEGFLVKVTRDGMGVGIYTVFTATRPGSARYTVINNFKSKIALQLTDKTDISTAVGRCAYELPEIQGRALIKLRDTHVAQCYLPISYEDDISYAKGIGEVIDEINVHNTGRKAMGVRVVPEVVGYHDLVPYLKPESKQAILGFDVESTEPVYLDLSIPVHSIVGNPSAGKTNVLKILLKQFLGTPCFIVDSRAGDLADYEGREEVTYMGAESHLQGFHDNLQQEVTRREKAYQAAKIDAEQKAKDGKRVSAYRLRDFTSAQTPMLVIIDDGDNFIELCKSKTRDMEALIPKAMEYGITFIITTTPTKLKGFDNMTKILRDNQSGVVLGNPSDQGILPVVSPQKYRAVVERGFCYKRGDVRQMKIPFVG